VKCVVCSNDFQPNARLRRQPLYCSRACAQRAYVGRVTGTLAAREKPDTVRSMREPRSRPITGTMRVRERQDRFMTWTHELILRALYQRDARIWQCRISWEAALGPPGPNDEKIERARKDADAARARRTYAARMAAGLPTRPSRRRRTRNPVSGSGN